MKLFRLTILVLLFLSFFGFPSHTQPQHAVIWKNVRVLVYTKNGKGYVHDNISSAVSCIQRLGRQYGFKVDTSANPVVMTEDNLKHYTLLIFPSTNNDVFDNDRQRLAFRRYIEAGGGFVGVHSVTGTERNWKWFKMMLGGTFAYHPKFQKFRVKVINSAHPSMRGMPAVWEKEDECYFEKELYPGPQVLMAHDLTSLDTSDSTQRNNIIKNTGTFGDLYPAVWSYHFDGGHTWCTVLGHDKKDYSNPLYTQHLLQGIEYVASQVKKIDFKKAYADTRDTPIRF
jgi:type 1 glutamine amidotransferase